jgi:arabinofuranosyltransferase
VAAGLHRAAGFFPMRRNAPLFLFLLILVCVAGFVVATTGTHVRFDRDVELTGSEVTREVTPGQSASLALHFTVGHALDADDKVFVHCESISGGVDAVRINRDADPPIAATKWTAQSFDHQVQIPFDKNVRTGRYEVYAGLFNPKTGARLDLVDPPTADNRALVGWVDVVPQDADDSMRTVSPWSMRFQGTWAPWLGWLGGAAAAALIAVVALVRRRDGASADVAADEDTGAEADAEPWWVRLAPYALPAIPFVASIYLVLEFIKDDAYISFRYAHNLVTGNGLVFNRGEHVEGFTNFLWVFVVAPFEALGWDVFQVCEVLGTLLGIACLALTVRMTEWLQRERGGLWQLWGAMWGAMWLACSSSFVLWAQAGLEQPLASLLPIAGAFVLWRARACERPGDVRRHLTAGLVMGAGCMTRPELHLLAILVGLPLVVDAVRARRITRAQLLYVAGILAVTVPCHAFRYAYYGSLVPNTFYVKTGGGGAAWHVGLRTLRDMFLFNYSGWLVVVAPLAFANRSRIVEKATMALIAVAFMAYYVSVGVDEMQWHRLYLPALPFLCVLAALGARNFVDFVVSLVPSETRARADLAATAGVWIAVAVAGGTSYRFTYGEMGGYNGHGDLAGTFHPDLGKFLVRHERPHALVAFQDMGSTPYHAPDIDFLDFFGLVDKTVAHARHDWGLHTFIGSTGDTQKKFDAQMRDYFFDRSPEWTIFTLYTPRGDENKLAKEFDQDPTGGIFGDAFRHNGVQFGLWDDPRFRERYVPVRTWPRSRTYYLTLFRRKDLWEQKPREVVLDAPPPNLGGAKATLEGGLELLGSEVTPSAPERHEVFVTTWWRLPGPMPKDTYFFIHLARPGSQTPSDHVPGDWMYPADRWQPGEILEDRVLVQLPPFVIKPGKYDVYIGVYRRGTSERIKVENGANDGTNRIPVGSVDVTPLWPLVQQLIPPTRLETMRRYPERIVDSHRWDAPAPK